MVIAYLSEATLVTVLTLLFVAIIYLALALSSLRERISKLEGKIEQEFK